MPQMCCRTAARGQHHDADDDVWNVRTKRVTGGQSYGRRLRRARGRSAAERAGATAQQQTVDESFASAHGDGGAPGLPRSGRQLPGVVTMCFRRVAISSSGGFVEATCKTRS